MIKQEAIAWVVRLHNSRMTSEDRRAFESWQGQSPAHARMFQEVSAVWEDPELHAAAARNAQAAPPLSSYRQPVPRRVWMKSLVAMAACAVLVVTVGIQFDLITRFQADHRTGVGERRMIELADGSTVILNTQTALATTFDHTARRIRLLKGEALFMVRSDAQRPFIVEGSHTATQAVGTEFIVRAQPGRDQVTVLEGSVQVASRLDENSASLVRAGSRIEVEEGQLSRPVPVDLSTVSAWVQGRLIVNGVPLTQVLEEIDRYYPGTILLWNQDIGRMRVTGTYNVEDPSKSLSLLAKTFPTQMFKLADRLVIFF